MILVPPGAPRAKMGFPPSLVIFPPDFATRLNMSVAEMVDNSGITEFVVNVLFAPYEVPTSFVTKDL